MSKKAKCFSCAKEQLIEELKQITSAMLSQTNCFRGARAGDRVCKKCEKKNK